MFKLNFSQKLKDLIIDSRSSTIAEVIISVLIVSVTISGTLNLIVQNIASGDAMSYIYSATNLAKNRIERLKAIDFSLLSDAVEVDTFLDGDGIPHPEGEFRRTTDIIVPYGGNSNLAFIDVKVYYAIRGVENAVPARMTTILNKY